ncbi:MAG TPA: hydroxymethylpyrimidine/phosphomethylpyrimidine kinase [Terriglobales bacterium]|nr:hydroxymethylpyrimidine/phosphomethylpyrimidine kinase [Terriglobales bacterium]
MPKNLLSIAGYDPSGGAGVGLDLRVFERLGFRGYGILTSVTAQDASRVESAFPLPAWLVRSQVRALERGRCFAGLKVGMVGSLENLTAVAAILAAHPGLPRVVDPVFESSSGLRLLERAALPDFLRILRGRASLLTPNLGEASTLAGLRVDTLEAMKEAAERIWRVGCVPCLVKGGHLRGEAVDVLHDGREFRVFRHPRLRRDVHGTGCHLSAAILGFLADGLGLEEACRRGIALTARGIRGAVPAAGGRRVFRFPR